MARESMYVESYLAETMERPITPGTYLAYVLRGRARRYSGRYTRALIAALERRVDKGEVRRVRSVGGGIAYVKA